MAGKNGKNVLRARLSVDGLVKLVRAGLEAIDIQRPAQSTYSVADAAMSAFAMFALKDPSLLAFDERRNERNLESLYEIKLVPSDTQMRAILDELPPEKLRPLFRDVFRELQRGKVLEQFVYLDGCYLLSLDGTGYFSSNKVHCDSCLKKEHDDGRVTYYHQMLGAVLVHPDRREVIPLCPEPIIKQDGATKNDCERNAARRFLAAFRREHPHLPVIVVEDGLSSNGPHIEDLVAHGMHYILGVKPGDHPVLFQEFEHRLEEDEGDYWEVLDGSQPNLRHRFTVMQDLPLNASHPEIRVTLLVYHEITRDPEAGTEAVRCFTWVTDLTVTRERAWPIMRGGRARWKVENETYNTLKNQGYHFEHNFGHGSKHLSVVFALLMMLAFLVDQTAQICDPLFQAACKKLKSKRALWEAMRALFRDFSIRTLADLYAALAYGHKRPALQIDSS